MLNSTCVIPLTKSHIISVADANVMEYGGKRRDIYNFSPDLRILLCQTDCRIVVDASEIPVRIFVGEFESFVSSHIHQIMAAYYGCCLTTTSRLQQT